MASLSQLLQKAWLRSEFIFPKYNRHVSSSASAPRSVKSGQRCPRALLGPCLLSAAVTVPPPAAWWEVWFYRTLSDGLKNVYLYISCPAICTILVLCPLFRSFHQTSQAPSASGSGSASVALLLCESPPDMHFLFHLMGHRAQTFPWWAKSLWAQSSWPLCWAKCSEVATPSGQKDLVGVPRLGPGLPLMLSCSASLALAFPSSRPTWLNFLLLGWRNTFAELE